MSCDLETVTSFPPRSASTASVWSSLDRVALCHSNHVHRYAIEAHALEEVFGVGVDVELAGLRVLREVESGNFWNVLIFAFSFLFLKFEGNTTNRAALNTFHQMGRVAGDLL